MKRTLAMFCDHANEVPMTCRCADNCYCKTPGLTCGKPKKKSDPRHADRVANYPGDFDPSAPPSSQYWLASGTLVDILHPKIEDIHFSDVVHGLARVQRFGGQTDREHYSVAEHSVLVSRLCLPQNAILGLLHDASEAFIGDIVTPLKRFLPIYYEIEERWQLAIGIAAGVGSALIHLPVDVKVADTRALQTERFCLYDPPRSDESGIQKSEIKLKGLRPLAAEKLFRARFKELTGVEP